ncbi:MAG: HEAT repeat domain-containing protein [Methanobacterium sp.]
MDAINDEDPIVRANAMVALSSFKNRKFLEIILPEIHDENYKVGEGKIKAFERMGGRCGL